MIPAYTKKNTSPQIGLRIYLFHSVIGSLMIVLLMTIAMATALLISGNPLVYSLFVGIGIVGPPYVVLMSMGGSKYPKWERFQMSMPIKRSDLVKSQYFNMAIASTLGIPIVTIVTVISYQMHSQLFGGNLVSALIGICAHVAVPLIMLGLLFPIASTRLGEGREEGVTFVCFLLAFAMPLLISMASNRLGLSEWMPPLISFGTSMVIYLVSYAVTKGLYAKMDF